MNLLLIGDSDSQLLACEALCQFPAQDEVKVTINALPREGTPEAVLKRAANIGTLWRLKLSQVLTHPQLLNFDAIGVFLTGSKMAEFRTGFQLLSGTSRPLLFCGFNGVVLEKFQEGISWRLGYDVICLNGNRDLDALKRITAATPFSIQGTAITGLTRNVVEAGLPYDKRERQLVFAEQVVMPRSFEDRARLVRILAGLAERSPGWRVVIKPRVSPEERTFHRVEKHISKTLLEVLGRPPANLMISYDNLADLLRQSRLMATVSSTAFFDALDFGCRPLVMADFGVNARNGSHVFAGSGVWTELDAVDDLDQLENDLQNPNPAWLQWIGYGMTDGPANLIKALKQQRELLQQDPGLSTKQLPPGYITSTRISFTQLRREAESAISEGRLSEAESLLQLAASIRPTHRNVKRRLGAVRCRNSLLRRLLLALTYRKLG
jgi:hypothetical protein